MLSKAQINRLNKLVNKYLRGEATSEEAAFVEKYYQYFDHSADLTDSLSENDIDDLQHKILEKIKEEMSGDKDKPSSTRNKWMGRLMAAAAVAIIVLGGTIFFQAAWKTSKVEEKRTVLTPVQNDVAPGGNRAMITLEDGSRIFLDSSNNGTISQQGNIQVVKLSDGEVLYKKLNNKSSSVSINTMSTPRGGQYQLTLADGTKVWMNAESSITYPTAFTQNERKVAITGEVYFEVAPMFHKSGHSKVPFIVKVNSTTGAGDMEIQVLGTHFNVNTYADNGSTTTTLLEGSVLIKNNMEEQILKPGQQAAVQHTIKVNDNVDTEMVMAWKNGFFSFSNTSLEMVMKQLTRWYDVDVLYEDKKPDMKFWGSISMNSNLSQVLKILEESKVNFRIENKTIIVLSNRQKPKIKE